MEGNQGNLDGELTPHQVSISRQREMKTAQDAQEQFHSLLKEYMGNKLVFVIRPLEKIQRKKAYLTSLTHCALSFVTAPLLTVSTSLQQSVQKNIYTIQDFQISDSSKASQGQKLQQRTAPRHLLRFAQLNMMNKNPQNLMLMNSRLAMNLPFQAPVYRNYFEAFVGLYKQGIRGFYKGNGVRCLHIFLFHKLNTDLTLYSEAKFPEFIKHLRQIPLAQEILLSCAIDAILHPLHVAEARFILQNRSKNFVLYEGLSDFVRKSWKESLRGVSLHIPRNTCIAMTGLKIQNEMSIYLYYAQSFALQILAYPFLTVQRRLECQSKMPVGLLRNDEYKGFFHALRRIQAEEGLLGFYRGFNAYIVAIMFWMSVLPQATDFLLNRMPLLEELSRGSQSQNKKNARDSGYKFDDDDDDEDEED